MLDWLLENFRMLLIVGVLLVVGIGQVSRVLGTALGILFWGLMAAIGSQVYARGGALGILDFAFPPLAFYALCLLMVILNLFSLRVSLAQQRRRRAEARAREEED